MSRIDLRGNWSFCLDEEKGGIDKKFYNNMFQDEINLPSTVSEAKKGTPSKEENTYFLTDPYLFEGYTWYSKMVEFPEVTEKELFLVLERTRISHIWVDDIYIGSNNSLCTAHRYQLTPYITKPIHKFTIMIDNTSYPIKGGHMTSPDTQTNWNGITGDIYINVMNTVYLTGVKIYPDAKNKLIRVKAFLNGAKECKVAVTVADEVNTFANRVYQLNSGANTFTYDLEDKAKLWSEHTPELYSLHMELLNGNEFLQKDKTIWNKEDCTSNEYDFPFGLRDFKAVGKHFEINGEKTFLRGKHDGLIFPMTGYAPTDLESWLEVLTTAKKYGINHYRFHTCCPPEAAFRAADLLGIYMEPELPFWGTVTEAGEENHDEEAQQYLIEEGFRILDEFGNHPSFVMMSMGNELWGSKNRLNQILGGYKEYDLRHLYTQGSNNFQFMPCILENDDFFCGVRFSKDRLFRGSYAMCDAPQGHVQTLPPDMIHNYDPMIRPEDILAETTSGGNVTIQYGTGTKTVKVSASEELIPQIPVVSHEIGQYAMYPDFAEIEKYTGVLKPRNLEVFRERLEKAKMLSMAERFFKASGRFAAECYKAEIEAAMRSSELAGFQLLDLQDFTGQGTALVGILNSFMENKGLISQKEWQQFCSDTVLLAELPKMVFMAGESVCIGVKLTHFAKASIQNPRLELTLSDGNEILLSTEKTVIGDFSHGVFSLDEFVINMPEISKPEKLIVNVKIVGSEIINQYNIWLYPECENPNKKNNVVVTTSIKEACVKLKQGSNVLLFPDNLDDTNSILGTYCTDFWCYPMFRSISESMNKPVPIGTLGLLIDKDHPVFSDFPTEYYTSPQWYDIISNSRAIILDDTDISPIVWSIDNFERNHRLGMIFEIKSGEGKLFVCSSNLQAIDNSIPAKWLEYSIIKYIGSDQFEPKLEKDIDELIQIL